ncbi:MAG: hypothetical protein QOG05_167, partial [Streptosporangiaceae bacterium]|nr:hypothetical protein [Streptosporangiaceae bacterium]
MTAGVTTGPPAGAGASRAGCEGFGGLLHAEWTKFRTVRGWVIGMAVAAMVTVLVGLLAAAGGMGSCDVAGCTVTV